MGVATLESASNQHEREAGELGVDKSGGSLNGKSMNSKGLAKSWSRLCLQLSNRVDQCATALLHSEKIRMGQESHQGSLSKTKLSTPEDEIKKLITTASGLEDVWHFFLKRLKNGSALDFICFSVLDERGDFIRVRFLDAGPGEAPAKAQDPVISMNDVENHLVQAYHRKDTTFSPNLRSLGSEILDCIPWAESQLAEGQNSFNLFSVPLIAGDHVIAMLTLGFQEMDAFSQAKLSYVYALRDQLAQLIWNLLLQDRMKFQAQIDNLTGLLSHTCFQGLLDKELAKSDQQNNSVTVMILDINNIQEINQSQGHTAGDEAICHIASTVKRLIRGLDTAARYGGDEVVVILPETEPKAANEIAQRFLEGMQSRLPEHLRHLSVSIGHATYPDDAKNREKLLKLAEQALHLAKFKGSKTGESTCIATCEINQLNDKTVIEVFASQVAKKYNNIHVPSVYQELLNHIEKKAPGTPRTEDMMLETITSLSGALEAKDRYTRGHSQAVSNYAVALAHALKMNATEVEEIRAAAFLHDIGKIGIPESILCKAGPLNEKEWEIMKQHPVIGAQQILYPVQSLRPIIPAVECHHESWDGSGHPHGYRGEKIPLAARVISIVDAFHALTSDRSYRKALSVFEAKKILEAGAGTKWDPQLTEIFFGILTIAQPKNAEVQAGEPQPESPVQLKLEPAS
jgi:diguanylate cyclase (GGDEF)-like protein/putative nucleotidyltransferase with HDIG domain